MGLLSTLKLKLSAPGAASTNALDESSASQPAVAASGGRSADASSQWTAVKASFEDAQRGVAALADASNPKIEAARKILGTIESYAQGGNFAKAVVALREMLPKLQPILDAQGRELAAAPGDARPADPSMAASLGASGGDPQKLGSGSDKKDVAPPNVSGVAPDRCPAKGGTKVVITGTGFTGATEVMFDKLAASFSVDSDTQITATTPDASRKYTLPSDLEIRVTTPAGYSQRGEHIFSVRFGESKAANPVDTGPPPNVTGVSPDRCPAKGGTKVVITGTGFEKATEIMFDKLAASFSVDSDTQITATTPDASRKYTLPSDLEIRVTTPAGYSQRGEHIFSVRFGESKAVNPVDIGPPPNVTGVSPDRCPAKGGTKVVITGTGFAKATEVMFDRLAASFTVDSDTQITATTPDASRKYTLPSDLEIRVTTPAGYSQRGEHIFSVRFGDPAPR